MLHMEGCENVFSASWSVKEKPALALLVPAIRESVNKMSHQKKKKKTQNITFRQKQIQSALCGQIFIKLVTYFAIL